MVGHGSEGIVWRWGEKKKLILGFLLRLFWGKCPTVMTYHPKEARISWNHWVHVMRDRERAHIL